MTPSLTWLIALVVQDYVYAFRPLTAVTVNASLCGSAFDTKLILYKESSSSTAPALVSCNDDACDSQSWLQVFSGILSSQSRFCCHVTPEHGDEVT